MEQKKYKLEYNDSFINDLTEITNYISYDLSNPIAADNLLDKISKSIIKRLQQPAVFKKYISKNNPKEIYYKIQVKNFTIFYVVIEDVMEVRRIIYSRRDLKKLI